VQRGEVWWADWPAGARHPVVLLSWDAHGDWRDQITVAGVTSVERGLDAEVILDRRDGMPRRSVANLDALATIPRSRLVARICSLSSSRMAQVERALHLALGMSIPCLVRD
jgi:mRNA-degrading endonuclease toxin of MazEF toxin-antitoxin module